MAVPPKGGTAILVRGVFANTHNSLPLTETLLALLHGVRDFVIQVRRKWCLYAVE